jgi:hypothetical protein
VRTAVQLIAGGALTALVTAVAGGLSPSTAAVVMAAWTVVVAAAQNGLEASGRIPALLPTPGLVPSAAPVVAPVVGTVETAVDKVGETVGDVSGIVQDTTGKLLGEVVPPGDQAS